MSLVISGKVRLLTTPKQGVSASGSPWANALAYCPNWIKTDAGWSENGGFTCSLGAFNDHAAALGVCSKGDVIEIVGKAKNVTIWSPPDRAARAQLDVTVEEVASVKSGGNRGDKPTDARSGVTRDFDGPGKVSGDVTQGRDDAEWPRPAYPDARKVAGQRGTARTPEGVSLDTPSAAPASSPVQASVGARPTQDQPTADVLDFRRGAMGRLTRQHRNSRLTGSSA